MRFPGGYMLKIKQKNLGSALLSALFIMTLVAIAATAMSSRLQLDISRTHLTIQSDKLYLASQSVTFWAMDALTKNSKKFTSYHEEGPLLSFPQKLQDDYPGVKLVGSLYDLQALFNMNNLLDKKFQPLGLRLLEHTLENKQDTERKLIVNSLIQWIIPYQAEHQQQDLLNYYLSQNPPYKPSYHAMQSTSELRLVYGIDRMDYKQILPFVTTLPETTPINLNTAPKTILAILGNGLNAEQVDAIEENRSKKGGVDPNTLALLLKKLDIPSEQVTLESNYFLAIATATYDDANLVTYTILKRSKNKDGVISIAIVNQSLNTM